MPKAGSKILVVKYVEPWAVTHQQRWHAEALQKWGERIVVRHRWNIRDYAQGRVGRCTSCSGGVRLNERQRVIVSGAISGTFTLTFAGQTTSSLQWDASSTEVQFALESLGVNNLGDVAVTGASINSLGLIVEFKGQWAYVENIPPLTYTPSLVGAGAAIEIVQVQDSTGGVSVQERFSAVYKQSGDSWCQSCFGIGFEGGFEPIVYVTFALVQDAQNETTRSVGGAIQREDPKIQFSFEPMVEEFDLMARVESWEADNITPREVHGRYILREVRPVTIRTGPGTPDDSLALMPPEFATRYQIPDRQWVVGQKAGIEIVPFEHAWNLVPLTRAEERLVEEGILTTRRWYEKGDAETKLDPRMTSP